MQLNTAPYVKSVKFVLVKDDDSGILANKLTLP
nr:MAG TPA: hypothetical protein [Caudoviricetes sp.]